MENTLKWEYKILKFPANLTFWGGKVDIAEMNSQIDEYGEHGWELTNAFTTQAIYGWSRDLVAIFKRPKR